MNLSSIEMRVILNALRTASREDVEFIERNIQRHSMTRENKKGFLISAIQGHPLDGSNLVSYVCSELNGITAWYVVDNFVKDALGIPKSIVVGSENEAKDTVITRLLAAFEAHCAP